MKGNIWVVSGAFALLHFGHAQPVITEQPQSKTAPEGRPVSFSVQAQGTGALSYQWQFNGADLPRADGRALTFYENLWLAKEKRQRTLLITHISDARMRASRSDETTVAVGLQPTV